MSFIAAALQTATRPERSVTPDPDWRYVVVPCVSAKTVTGMPYTGRPFALSVSCP